MARMVARSAIHRAANLAARAAAAQQAAAAVYLAEARADIGSVTEVAAVTAAAVATKQRMLWATNEQHTKPRTYGQSYKQKRHQDNRTTLAVARGKMWAAARTAAKPKVKKSTREAERVIQRAAGRAEMLAAERAADQVAKQKAKRKAEREAELEAERESEAMARKAAVATGAEWALERTAQRRMWALNGQCPIDGAR